MAIQRVRPPLHALAVGALALALAAGCQRDVDVDAAAVEGPAGAAVATDAPATGTPARPDAQMQAVLDQLAQLGGKPLETLTPEQARQQPTPADAVGALLKSLGKDPGPEAVASVENRTIPGPAGEIPIRIYTPISAAPAANPGQRPVILYIHGGGWVIADLDTYDSSARALANAANAVVVSTHYRQGPEAMFPAAHEDTLAAYKWVLDNAGSFGANPKQVAVVGESAGGNMAANIAIAARDQKLQMPVHQVLVYPVAGADMTTASYTEHANAKPLSKPMMEWFARQYVGDMSRMSDPRIALVQQQNLANLPPATVILAEIDPLRSEGQQYGEALQKAGVPTVIEQYNGVTHEFFGMGAVLDKAREAQQLVGQRLRAAFAGAPGGGQPATTAERRGTTGNANTSAPAPTTPDEG
ncbi:alpha/beta hydrolase [Cognatilysobacter bugurensis]|uniref:Acetylhydrolase n=1 Tax=Cognatilysobacter bugurensis TaxID=543356 RepID=A0A918T050_9GAMM|nr:alpha/beta hydrolase [Lysobacter bugurensis]GHA82390.1 acetylhydrolase [Lysobacter bugurensis]